MVEQRSITRPAATRRSDTAVIALHYQNDVIHADGKVALGLGQGSEGAERREAVIRAAARLMAGARRHRVPVVHVRIAFRPDFGDVPRTCAQFRSIAKARVLADGSWGAAFHERLLPREGDTVITHNRNNAFHGPELDACLQAMGARRLVVAGVATNFSVEHTVRHAADAGYVVTVVPDACAAGMPGAHEASLRTLAMLATLQKSSGVIAGFRRRGRV